MKKLFQKFKDWLGRREPTIIEDVKNPFLRDQGPATVKYVRSRMPRSCFTKPMTPSRQKAMREALLKLRPEQRAIAYKKSWNKGIRV